MSNLITFLSWKNHDKFFQYASLALDNPLLQPKDFREDKEKDKLTIDDMPQIDKYNITDQDT